MKTLKKISPISFLIFILIFPITSEAQLLNRIKRAAERGVSNAVEKKVESEAEKIAMRQIEKALLNLYGEDFANQSGMDFSKIMSGINADVETDEAYDFSGYAVMEIKSKDEKGKAADPMEIKSFLSDDPTITAMEMQGTDNGNSEGKMVMIYDFDRNASIILMDNEGEKTRMAYGFDFAKMSGAIPMEEMEESQDTPDYSFEKTGNTKTINGYSCEEYLMESDDATVRYWITEKPIQGNVSMWGQNNPWVNARMKNQNASNHLDLPEGNILEMFMESKTDESTAEILVKEINPNEGARFVMADYPSVFDGAKK
jgi:hypothetical protein